MVGTKNKRHHSVVQKVMDLGPVNHRATEQCQVECPEAHHLINPWVTAWLWTSLLWAVGQGQCCPAPWHKHGDAGTEQHDQKTQIHYNSRAPDLGASSQQLPASHTEPPYQTFNWSRSDGKVAPWPTKYSSWKNIILSVTGVSSFGVHSNTATLALATTGCYLSGSSQWALQECLYPNCRVDMPQSKLPCSFQIPASTQGDISTTAVLNQVNWPSHLKRLSTLNRTHSPQPPSVIKLVFVEATLTVPEHTGVLFCTEEPLIGLPSGVTHQQYPV